MRNITYRRIGRGMLFLLLLFVGLTQANPTPSSRALSPTVAPSWRIPTAFIPAALTTPENSPTTTTTWQWPLQNFRMIFAEYPNDEEELILAERLSDYLTQQLQLYYSETVLLQTQVTLIATQIDWQIPYFVYEFVGDAVMALPPTSEQDVAELQRWQIVALANQVTLHAFWKDTAPLLWYLPPKQPNEENKMEDSKWIWIVIALVAIGGVVGTVCFVWYAWNRHDLQQQRRDDTLVKEQQAALPVLSSAPPHDEAASVAWSTPLGKVIPATFYVTTRTPSEEDDDSLTQTPSMSASPIRAPVHQFETDSILMDGYDSDPEHEDDPESPPRPRKSTIVSQTAQRALSFPQPQPPSPFRSEPQSMDPSTMTRLTVANDHVETESSSLRSTKRGRPSQRQAVVETKKAIVSDDTSLPSDEERVDNASVSPENDVLGYYLRRKRG